MTKLLPIPSLLSLIATVLMLLVTLLVPRVIASLTKPIDTGDQREPRLQVTSLIFHPDHTMPRIFREYSFPKMTWCLTQSQREDLVHLVAWNDWYQAFGGYPPVWELPECMPPALQRMLGSESIDSPEYWRRHIRQIRQDVLTVERIVSYWFRTGQLMPKVPEQVMRRFMMHHYPGYPTRDRDFMEQGGSRRTPMYVGYGYSVLGELNIFSRFLRTRSGLEIANLNEVKTLGAQRVLSQAHMPRNEVLWALPGSCFCSQYFWSGDVH